MMEPSQVKEVTIQLGAMVDAKSCKAGEIVVFRSEPTQLSGAISQVVTPEGFELTGMTVAGETKKLGDAVQICQEISVELLQNVAWRLETAQIGQPITASFTNTSNTKRYVKAKLVGWSVK